jgi:hypothetical protein
MPMRKYVKWCVGIIVTPFILFAILAILFYFPPFQQWAVKQVASYASEKTKTEITVNHINLEFPLNLGIEGVKVLQQNDSMPQVKDTVADIKKVVANIRLLPLFSKKIDIDKLSFDCMKVNTTNFIHEARVKGNIARMDLVSHCIDLGAEHINIDKANLKNAVLDVALSDTVPKDTTKKTNFWKINVHKLNVDKTDLTVHMPGDTLQVQAYLGKSIAEGGYFDLYRGLYKVKRFNWKDGRLNYDNNFKVHSKGLDYNHISLSNIAIGIDNLSYFAPKLIMTLRECAFREQSGFAVDALTGKISLDSARLLLPNLYFKTPQSYLCARVALDLNAFAENNPGKFNVSLNGSFGKYDLMRFMGGMPSIFRKQWPNYPLRVSGIAMGNMQSISFSRLAIKLPTAFNLTAKGFLANIDDTKNLRGNVNVKAHTYKLGFAMSALPKKITSKIRIPSGISVDGALKFNRKKYAANLIAREGHGHVRAIVDFNSDRTAYDATIKATNLQLQHFLPNYGLHPFTGFIALKGRGVDPTSSHTSLTAKTRISKFNYAGYNLDCINANVKLQNGVADAIINSGNPLLKGNINLSALMHGKRVKATLICDLAKADLFNLKLTKSPLFASICAHLDIESDMNKYYKVNGMINDLAIHDKKKYYKSDAVAVDVLLRRDTTHAVVNSGDFNLNMNVKGGYERLLSQGQSVVKEIQRQLKDRVINQVLLRRKLPDANIVFSSGKNNLLVYLLNKYGYCFSRANVDMRSSHIAGLTGNVSVDSLVMDSIRLDTVRFNIKSDNDKFVYSAQVINNKQNPQYIFHAIVDGELNEHGSYLKTKLYDANDKLGIQLGLLAEMEHNGIRMSILGDNPILGYKTFNVNNGNFIFLGDDRRLSANLQLKAGDGMGVQVYTDDENKEALQDLTISLHQFKLHDILSALPYTPDISGVLNGDYHLIQTKEELSVSSNMTVDKMIYEHCPMGNIGTEFVYMPKKDGSHYVDGIFSQNGLKIATVKGTYKSEGAGYIDANLGFDRTPMDVINGFIPNQLIGFKGYAEGALSMNGTLSKPNIKGEIYLDSAYMVSQPYGVEMRFDNDPVTITDSKLLFENFQMYAHNDSPLTMSGYLDFSDLDKIAMDVKMRATNYEIIDYKENIRSEAFGKAFVNFYGRMYGRLDNLQMKGKLDVLGATDMTYILRDSPITTDNQLDGLVKFTDFQDSTAQIVNRPPLTGFNMDLSMNINESAHILCALNADKSNYVDLIGGGDLRMQYNTVDNLRLTGRYTLNNGEMKYSLPIIPLKTFNIQDGSYIEFNGDPMNPKLNITATETNKATVSSDGGTGRTVSFECGVKITKTLKDMGLEFLINSPEDMAVSNQLNTMSIEERGKIAVTMLTTGMYLADGNTSGFSMNSALSAFLQSQINGIAGNALKTLDLSFGMDNSTDASGNQHTDYSFKFAKRFWNNRLRIIVGGKFSTGPDIANQNQSFFSNVSFEYRLNEASTQYLKLFYDRDSYDWLEGDVGQYGAGFIWRRKVQHFSDLFRFKEPDTTISPIGENDDNVKQK